MPETQIKENPQRVIPMTFNDMIWLNLQELGKRMDQLDKRMDKLETRVEKLEDKLDKTRQELNARMDKQDEKIDRLIDKMEIMQREVNNSINDLRKDIKSATNHGNIMTASVVSIALGVLYSIFLK